MDRNAPSPSAELAASATEYWQGRLRADPIEATILGDRRFDEQLPDPSRAANEKQKARWEALLGRVRRIPEGELSETDQITRAALIGELESDLSSRTCFLSEWAVDPRDGPQVGYLTLPSLQPVTTLDQARALLARWRKIPADLDARAANLSTAKRAGRVAAQGGVVRVLRQLDDLLAVPLDSSPLLAPAREAHPGWPPADLARWRSELTDVVRGAIVPAFARYRQTIATEILPASRGDQRVGLSFVPGGVACYQRLIRVHTSLTLDADEVHRIGLAEVARIRAEMETLGARALGTRNFAEVQARLRSDASLHFTTRDEIEAKARAALARAQAALPRWLGRVPSTPCEVKRIEAFEEKDATIAYYRQPAADGSRPGAYYVNTYAPHTRPRFEAEALAFHESVPGHHVQIALASEAVGLPDFRKHLGVTAFVEGWALYTERLADEMGLYSGDVDRLGMLSFDAWRASRLVVDTGLHAQGWSRQRAVDYLREHTALADNNVDNEVDRYIGWPGQALAYKLGQLEIRRLRSETEATLGPRFDLPSFHDAVLANGAVGLPVLRHAIERWAKGRAGAAR